ncbi:MAG: hypothetical protein KatS3mg028_0791 [Bacteroidia bacterium]|nr:MAG: hypothetical protein KatS3mg028_0791 [Bacteroidia bacterium]
MKNLFQKTFLPSLLAINALFHAQTHTFTTTAFIRKINATGNSDVQYFFHHYPYTEISGDTAKIQLKNDEIWINNASVVIKSNHKDIQLVQASGTSKIQLHSVIESDRIILSSRGASGIRALVQSRTGICTAEGMSDVAISGHTDSLIVRSYGSSSVKAKHLCSKYIKVNLEGTSDAFVFPDSSISGSINGLSKLVIYGNPKVINIEKTSNLAEIKHKNFSSSEYITSPDSSKKNKWKFYRKKYSFSNKSWEGISFGINGYLSPDNQLTLPGSLAFMQLNYSQSLNFQLNLPQTNIYLYKKNIAIATGFGFEWKRFSFDNTINLNPDTTFTYAVIDTTKVFNYKRNLLKAAYLQMQIPVGSATNYF